MLRGSCVCDIIVIMYVVVIEIEINVLMMAEL